MSLYEILTVVTCITSTMTMIIVAVAILPHFKSGLAVVRDAVLWASLVLILAIVGWLGFRQLVDYRTESGAETAGLNTLQTSHERRNAPSSPTGPADDQAKP